MAHAHALEGGSIFKRVALGSAGMLALSAIAMAFLSQFPDSTHHISLNEAAGAGDDAATGDESAPQEKDEPLSDDEVEAAAQQEYIKRARSLTPSEIAELEKIAEERDDDELAWLLRLLPKGRLTEHGLAELGFKAGAYLDKSS